MTGLMECDFLSSFLKIDRIELVKRAYGVQQVSIAQGVYQELSATSLKEPLDRRDDVLVETVSAETVPDDPDLGLGERESIALAEQKPDSVLLMSDRKAVRVAIQRGLRVVNIPVFLGLCKATSLLTTTEIAQIMDDLKTRNGYEFRLDDRDRLLADKS